MVQERIVTTATSTLGAPPYARVSPSQTAPTGDLPPAAETPVAGRSSTSFGRAEVSALIEKEYSGLRLLITRRAGDPQVAADLLNDALCTTWAKWQAGQIERPELIAGYVFQVAMNLLRNRRRAMGTRPDKRANSDALETLQAAAEPRDEVITSQITARVKAMVRSMGSERDRDALVRFYLDEQDKETICAELKLSPLQFDKVLHRARRRLRQLLESQGLKPSDLFSILLVM
jgi:RNA polymerase sigma-70 factor (ECF subfamily)